MRLAIGLVVLLIGVWLGGHPGWLPSGVRGTFEDNSNGQFVNQVLDMLSHDYYRPVDRSQLVNKGLAAAIASLDDPYSHYYDPSAYKAFLNQDNPHLNGIGIDVQNESKGLRVVDVFDDSPAARAGLARGDVIVAVGASSLANRSADFGSKLIRGEAGSKVTLTIQRGGQKKTITITRANIVVPVASGKVINFHGKKIGYVQLTSFTDGSGAELRAQVNKVLHQGAHVRDPRSQGERRRPARRGRQRRQHLPPGRDDRVDRRTQSAQAGVRGQGRRDLDQDSRGGARRSRHRVSG